jgi:hypothetical protein
LTAWEWVGPVQDADPLGEIAGCVTPEPAWFYGQSPTDRREGRIAVECSEPPTAGIGGIPWIEI